MLFGFLLGASLAGAAAQPSYKSTQYYNNIKVTYEHFDDCITSTKKINGTEYIIVGNKYGFKEVEYINTTSIKVVNTLPNENALKQDMWDSCFNNPSLVASTIKTQCYQDKLNEFHNKNTVEMPIIEYVFKKDTLNYVSCKQKLQTPQTTK